MADEAIIEVKGLRTQFGTQVVHDNLDLSVKRGEILAIVGGSGSGKSVLLHSIIGLLRPRLGTVRVLGREIETMSDDGMRDLEKHWGVLFQDGALFSSLSVAQNIEVPMAEHVRMPPKLRLELATLKVAMVGLAPEALHKFPSELSGGMKKRAGLARALALDPEILFLDEPTAGLDPIGAAAFDRLIRELRDALGLTVVMVTHDLDTLRAVTDRIAVLIDKRVKVGTLETLMHDPHPWLQEYFNGPRGRLALAGLDG